MFFFVQQVEGGHGGEDATVSFMTQKMKVEFEDGAAADTVMQEVLKNCKKVESDCEIFL